MTNPLCTGKAQAFGDLWSLDMTNADVLSWAKLETTGGPPPRSKHTCTPVRSALRSLQAAPAQHMTLLVSQIALVSLSQVLIAACKPLSARLTRSAS